MYSYRKYFPSNSNNNKINRKPHKPETTVQKEKGIEKHSVKVNLISAFLTLIAVSTAIYFSNKNLGISKLSYNLSQSIVKNNERNDSEYKRVIMYEDSIMTNNAISLNSLANTLQSSYINQISEDRPAIELWRVDFLDTTSEYIDVKLTFHNSGKLNATLDKVFINLYNFTSMDKDISFDFNIFHYPILENHTYYQIIEVPKWFVVDSDTLYYYEITCTDNFGKIFYAFSYFKNPSYDINKNFNTVQLQDNEFFTFFRHISKLHPNNQHNQKI